LYNSQRSCHAKRVANFVDTLHNQKDTPLVTNFFLTSMLDEDCSPFEFPYDLTRINDVLSSVFRTKKPAYPGDKSPGQLALTLLFTPAPKNGFRPSGLVSHYTGSLLNNGGVFVTTAQNITWGKAVKVCSISRPD
jgi:hypothetical protein